MTDDTSISDGVYVVAATDESDNRAQIEVSVVFGVEQQ